MGGAGVLLPLLFSHAFAPFPDVHQLQSVPEQWSKQEWSSSPWEEQSPAAVPPCFLPSKVNSLQRAL